MKIKYEFADGTVTEVEADDNIGSFIVEDRRKEENLERKERYHCYPLDAAEFDSLDVADTETPESILSGKAESEKINAALAQLTEVQKRRLLMYASDMTIREIAAKEGVYHTAVMKSIEQSRKILKKFL